MKEVTFIMEEIMKLSVPGVEQAVSAQEWQVRVDLAALYRLVASFGWDDLVFTHLSARVPGDDEHFLINPYGLLYDEMCASNMVKVDLNGDKVMDSPFDINPAGFIVHSAVHEVRHDAMCVAHWHSRAGVAVAAQKKGLLPISQQASLSLASIAYHDYEGIAVDEEEKQSLQRDLGDKVNLVLRNHGLLVVGETIADAFLFMYNLESACQIQIAAMAGNSELIHFDQAIIDDTGRTTQAATKGMLGGIAWPALIRRLDKKDPSFRD
jgi:ribulose-5-phosphate 4-epimerase/fuculose-1-phosphate aldolase